MVSFIQILRVCAGRGSGQERESERGLLRESMQRATCKPGAVGFGELVRKEGA